MQVDPLAKVGYVLGRLVRNARDIILIDEHGGGALGVGGQLLHIDDGAIGDAANFGQPNPALTLQFGWTLRLAPEERIAHRGQGECCQDERIGAERNCGLRI